MTTAERIATDRFVIEFDCRRDGQFITAECQFGAHWGCPGGIRDEAQARVLVCRCPQVGCSCNRHGRRAPPANGEVEASAAV
ncbi:hypothetical protein [Kitasatospora sp. NPDC050543]|uniref:hypothetical protein n=1 Tax=Kitasatospora sp. NPDC050543 TaxID=3364054 RepID=UPI00378DF128